MPSHDKRSPSLIVAIALDIAHHQKFINRFNQTLWLSLITVTWVLLMCLLGWLAVRRGLSPIRDFDRIAQSIIAAIYLPEKSRYDYLTSLPQSATLGVSIRDAMVAIEDEVTDQHGNKLLVVGKLRLHLSMQQVVSKLVRQREALGPVTTQQSCRRSATRNDPCSIQQSLKTGKLLADDLRNR